MLSQWEDKVYISVSLVGALIELLHSSYISRIFIEKLNSSQNASRIREDDHHDGEQDNSLDDFDEFIEAEFDLQDTYFEWEAGNEVNCHVDES